MNQSKNNIDNTQPQNPDSGDSAGGDNTKMFTQEQVNKIVEERLKKEKIKTGALKDLKDAVMDLSERGYFDKYKDGYGKNLSISDMADILLEEIRKLGENENNMDIIGSGLLETSNPEVHQPNQSYQSLQYNHEDMPIPEAEIFTPQNTMPDMQGQRYSQPPKWSVNPKIFELFAQNKNLSMENILDDYLKFVVQVEQAGQVRQTTQSGNIEEESFANGFNNHFGRFPDNTEQKLGTKNQNINRQNNITQSGYNSISPAQSHRTGDNFALTERQKELARAGGMTYREYFEFINSISTKKLKK